MEKHYELKLSAKTLEVQEEETFENVTLAMSLFAKVTQIDPALRFPNSPRPVKRSDPHRMSAAAVGNSPWLPLPLSQRCHRDPLSTEHA